MKLGRIAGSVVSTRKDPSLASLKLMIVENVTTGLEREGGYVIAVDSVGAGDAFTAMLLGGMALGRDLAATLRLANRYAAMICGVRGPLPADPATLAPWREALHALPAENRA